MNDTHRPVSRPHHAMKGSVTDIAAGKTSPARHVGRSDIRRPKAADEADFDVFAVIDDRSLERECFVACLQQLCPSAKVIGFETIENWRASMDNPHERQVILHNIGAKSLTDEAVRTEVRALVTEAQAVPVVLLGASDDVDAMIAALECGTDGYIPPSVHVRDIIKATQMTVAGSSFVSTASLMALRNGMVQVESNTTALKAFTDRQLAVAQVLRRGAANKMIACELDLQESTVKVHIRHIFEKLHATNRTEAAFILNQMSGWPDEKRPS